MKIADIIYILLALVVSISVHEMMHSAVAYYLGDQTSKLKGRLSLNPLPHIDPMTTVALPLIMMLSGLPPLVAAKPVPVFKNNLRFGDFGMAIVAIAGPLTNLMLAVSAALLHKVAIDIGNGVLLNFLNAMLVINVSIFVFNMIPFPPLDGSRVLYALAPSPVQNIMDKIESYGFMSILILVLVISNTPIGIVLSRITTSIIRTLRVI
jgi:Zn-dependent protease